MAGHGSPLAGRGFTQSQKAKGRRFLIYSSAIRKRSNSLKTQGRPHV